MPMLRMPRRTACRLLISALRDHDCSAYLRQLVTTQTAPRKLLPTSAKRTQHHDWRDPNLRGVDCRAWALVSMWKGLPKVAGSNPAPATSKIKGFGNRNPKPLVLLYRACTGISVLPQLAQPNRTAHWRRSFPRRCRSSNALRHWSLSDQLEASPDLSQAARHRDPC